MALLEREAQLADLHRAVAEAAAGRGRTVLVTGEAGIGKTSLVEQFAEATGERARVLWGSCEALFAPRPLGPFYDIVHALGGPLLVQLQADAKHIDLFHALIDDLRRYERSSTLIIEDVHWADHATLDFIKFLGRRISKLPAVLVLTFRDDEIGAEHPLSAVLGELAADSRLRLKLPVLSRATVEDLAREAGRAPSDLYRITGGNPLFVTEVLRSETDTVAPSIRESVLARTRHLSSAARDVLDLVSVVPDRIELALLERLIGANLRPLGECFDRGLLSLHDTHVTFRHELTRLAVEEALSVVKRIRLNREILEALAKTPNAPDMLTRLAHHAIAAKHVEAIVRYAPEAAAMATKRGAHREAAALLAAVLQYAERMASAERAAYYEQRCQACFLIDQGAEAIAMSEAANALWQELGDEFAEGRNLVRRCEISYDADFSRRNEIDQIADKAAVLLELSQPSAELALAKVWQGRLIARREPNRSRAYFVQAMTVVEAIGDPEALVVVLSRTAHLNETILWGADSNDVISRLFELSRKYGIDSGVLWAYRAAAGEALRSRDLSTLERLIDEGLRFADNRQLDRYIPAYILQDFAIELDLHRGRWEAVDALTQKLTGAKRADFLTFMHRLRASPMYCRVGREEGKQWLDEALIQEGRLNRMARFMLHRALAEFHWLHGNWDATRISSMAIWKLGSDSDHPWMRGESAIWMWLTAQLNHVPENIAEPYALQCAGDWRGASQAWKRLGFVYEEGFALMFGDKAGQCEALEIFERLGAKAAAERCRVRMREQGIRNIPRGPTPNTRSNPFGLTERELETLNFLAEGLANAGIAARIHRAVKTVDHHVAAVIDKVGARNRHEAVVLARKRGLLAK